MPVNIMLDAPLTPIDLEAGCNVARINVGPLGYQLARKDLATRFAPALMMCLACPEALKRASTKNGPVRKWPRMVISEMPLTRPQWQRSRNGRCARDGWAFGLFCIAQILQCLLNLIQNRGIIYGCGHFKRFTIGNFNHCAT